MAQGVGAATSTAVFISSVTHCAAQHRGPQVWSGKIAGADLRKPIGGPASLPWG